MLLLLKSLIGASGKSLADHGPAAITSSGAWISLTSKLFFTSQITDVDALPSFL